MTWNRLREGGETAGAAGTEMVPGISCLPLCYCRSHQSLQLRSCLKQSTDVVRERHQRPFAFHFPHPAQSEPVKPAGRFDVAEHRLHDRLATTVHLPSGYGAQLALHALLARAVLGNPPARGRLRDLRVLVFPDGDVEVDAPDGLGGDIRFTEVARVGRQA